MKIYKLHSLPNREFKAKIDKILKNIPALGKLLSSIFGVFEYFILEFFRKLDRKFDFYTMGFVNRYILKGRWGGRVVPLNLNIDVNTKFSTSQEILEILKRSNVAAIGKCYCRSTQRKYDKPNCDHPIYSCIHLGVGKSLYEVLYKSNNLKKVSKEEIEDLLLESDRRGLVHQLIYFPNPQFYYVVCNCCPCCCVVLNKFIKYGAPHMIKSDFVAKTDLDKCTNCGTCEKWCYFGSRKLIADKLNVNSQKCFGCGICVSKCPNKAISLIQKKERIEL